MAVKKIKIECPFSRIETSIEKINKIKEAYPKAKIYIKFIN